MDEKNENPVVERLTRIEDRLIKVDDGLTKVEDGLIKVESDIAWLKSLYRSLDYRVWFILAGVIITILVSILR